MKRENMAHSSDDEVATMDEDQQNHDNEALEKQSTSTSALRAQSAVSRIRSREPGQTAPFMHPLSHMKTSEDMIVDFDGPDDPYRPMNWGFRKKAVTTLLYGLTTMGMFSCVCLFETMLMGLGATWASSM